MRRVTVDARPRPAASPDLSEAAPLWSALGQVRRAWGDRDSCANCPRTEREEHNAAVVWREAASDLVATFVVVDGRTRRDPTVNARDLLLHSVSRLTRTWRVYAQKLEHAADASDRCRAQVLRTAADELESVAQQGELD